MVEMLEMAHILGNQLLGTLASKSEKCIESCLDIGKSLERLSRSLCVLVKERDRRDYDDSWDNSCH